MRRDEEDLDGDPEEAVVNTRPGPHALPWHPGSMGPPHVYKICLMGPRLAGKSCIVRRLVAHTFESHPYRPTMDPQQLFWRHHDDAQGHDILVELEDTPGITGVDPSTGELTPDAEHQLNVLLKPLLWFEKYKRDKDTKVRNTATVSNEADPLLPNGMPKGKQTVSRGDKWKQRLTEFASAGSAFFQESVVGKKRGSDKNPIAAERKRMGFVVVADVSSKDSFNAAFAVVDRIFERLQFDASDNISCPVAVMVVGNKCDMLGTKRDPSLGPEHEVREQVLERFANVDLRINNVTYAECSARTNVGLEALMLQMLFHIHALPQRAQIKAARLHMTGMWGRIKRVVFVKFPILFDVEESLKKLHAGYIRPALQKLGIIDFLFGVDGIVPMTVKRAGKTWVACIKFRWICDWCPPFMRKLKQEVDQEEQEALAEEQAQDLERRQAAAAGGGDDGGDAGTG